MHGSGKLVPQAVVDYMHDIEHHQPVRILQHLFYRPGEAAPVILVLFHIERAYHGSRAACDLSHKFGTALDTVAVSKAVVHRSLSPRAFHPGSGIHFGLSHQCIIKTGHIYVQKFGISRIPVLRRGPVIILRRVIFRACPVHAELVIGRIPCTGVISYLKGKERELITVLLEKVEMENIKNALRLWYSSVIRSHQITYRSSYISKEVIVHPVDYNAIINSRDYEGVKAAFSGTIYEPVFASSSLDDIRLDGLFSLEISLDHLWFKRLFEAIASLNGEDRSVSEAIYLVDADLKNILLYIRYSLYHHLSSAQLKAVMIPYGHVYEAVMRKRLLERPDSLDEVRAVVGRYYPSVMKDLRDIRKYDDDMTSADENAEHIVLIEQYLAETRKKEFLKILTGRPFNIGIALSYFFLYKDENRMIRSIMSAKFYKWDETRIREAIL